MTTAAEDLRSDDIIYIGTELTKASVIRPCLQIGSDSWRAANAVTRILSRGSYIVQQRACLKEKIAPPTVVLLPTTTVLGGTVPAAREPPVGRKED